MNIAIASTWADRLYDLGNIPASRIRMVPAPGTATVEDVTRLRNTERRLYELVDGWWTTGLEPLLYFVLRWMPRSAQKAKPLTVATSSPVGKSISQNYSVASTVTLD